jgi:hypothetical protein
MSYRKKVPNALNSLHHIYSECVPIKMSHFMKGYSPVIMAVLRKPADWVFIFHKGIPDAVVNLLCNFIIKGSYI